MQKTVSTVTLNTQKRDNLNNELITVRQGDKNSHVVKVNILNDNQAYDLTGLTAELIINKPDATVYVQSAKNINLNTVDFELTSELTSALGYANAFVRIKDGEGNEVDSTNDFKLEIISGIKGDAESISKNYVDELEKAIATVKDKIASLQLGDGIDNTKNEELQKQLSDLQAKLSEYETKADLANELTSYAKKDELPNTDNFVTHETLDETTKTVVKSVNGAKPDEQGNVTVESTGGQAELPPLNELLRNIHSTELANGTDIDELLKAGFYWMKGGSRLAVTTSSTANQNTLNTLMRYAEYNRYYLVLQMTDENHKLIFEWLDSNPITISNLLTYAVSANNKTIDQLSNIISAEIPATNFAVNRLADRVTALEKKLNGTN